MKREYPDQPVIAVGAAVCRGEQVLIVQRGRPPSEGRWTLPGGVVNLGESLAEAAAREVREECGIEIEVGGPVGIVEQVVRDEEGRIRFHYAIVDLAGCYVGGALAPNEELLGAAWVRPDELRAYGVSSQAQEALRRALALNAV